MKYKQLQPTETTIYIAPYKAKQLYMVGYSNRGDLFDAAKEPMRTLYNEYFGGSIGKHFFIESHSLVHILAQTAYNGICALAGAGVRARRMCR